MAKFDVRSLNYIVCGTKQNAFNIEYRYTDDGMILSRTPQLEKTLSAVHVNTFFGDVGTNETMNQRFATNKSSFYDISSGIIIHGLYNLTKSRLRSTATKKSEGLPNIDVFMPSISNDFIGVCQLQNYAYGLTREMTCNPINRKIEFNNKTFTDTSYHYKLSTDGFDTYMYPTINDLTNDPAISTYQLYVLSDDEVILNPELSDSRISTIFSPARNLSGIGYNYVLEIPLGTLLNKYENGFIQCDMVVTKNPHEYLYNINVINDEYNLCGCREYCNINACGDLAYLTYRTNVSYDNNNKFITYYDNIPEEYDQLSNDTIDYPERRQLGKDTYTYLHVEIIESINRFDGINSSGIHKPSLFSIKLLDIGLNNSTILDTTKQKLRQNISNNIRKIAEKICPANTQLFKVYFEGL